MLESLFDVSGKVVLVTGGSRGIGKMIAAGFVDRGAKVYITARKSELCKKTADELSKLGHCEAIPADLTVIDRLPELVAEIDKKEGRLDVLINNAGAVWAAPFEDYPEEAWDKVHNVNVKAVFYLTRHALPLLQKAATPDDPARVINIGSISGMHVPPLEIYAYCASKAGVHHLTKTLADRLARDDVTVNAIAPGPFESKMMAATLDSLGGELTANNPRKRIGTLEDIAGTAIYLASRAGAYTTGAIIPVDGGMYTTL